MSRMDVNRSGEMEVFVRAVALGGFSAAARELRLTPSAVSKLVTRLETRLGARLVNRTTRRLELTPEGVIFHDRAQRILADIEEAERSAAQADLPVGRIRINTSASYGTHILAPILPGFLSRYPGVSVEIVQTDRVVDLLAERADIAIRAGELASSSLVARRLGETELVVVAAPACLDALGRPETLAGISRLNRLSFTYTRSSDDWRLVQDGVEQSVKARSTLQANDGEALRYFAISGAGMTRLAYFTVRADIEAGRLARVAPGRMVKVTEAFHAVYVGQGGLMPARVRVMLDYLAEFGRVE
ncbi:LysR family transcriptional regulator [Rhizobium sp.]